jgi:hypothetical protein
MAHHQTRDNSKGNINRWFYSCGECRYMVFDDWEGIRNGNPLCECGEISRGQVERVGYVFRCARGECEYRAELDGSNKYKTGLSCSCDSIYKIPAQ